MSDVWFLLKLPLEGAQGKQALCFMDDIQIVMFAPAAIADPRAY
jgi:hypothetical protein